MSATHVPQRHSHVRKLLSTRRHISRSLHSRLQASGIIVNEQTSASSCLSQHWLDSFTSRLHAAVDHLPSARAGASVLCLRLQRSLDGSSLHSILHIPRLAAAIHCFRSFLHSRLQGSLAVVVGKFLSRTDGHRNVGSIPHQRSSQSAYSTH